MWYITNIFYCCETYVSTSKESGSPILCSGCQRATIKGSVKGPHPTSSLRPLLSAMVISRIHVLLFVGRRSLPAKLAYGHTPCKTHWLIGTSSRGFWLLNGQQETIPLASPAPDLQSLFNGSPGKSGSPRIIFFLINLKSTN